MNTLGGKIQPIGEDLLKVGPLVVGDWEPSRISVAAFHDHVIPECALSQANFSIEN